MGNQQSSHLPSLELADTDDFDLAKRTEIDTEIDQALDRLPTLSLHTSSISPSPANPSSPLPPLTTGVVYDRRMCLHRGERTHPERPNRTRSIAHHLVLKGLLEKCVRIPAREATAEEKSYVHTESEQKTVSTHWEENKGDEETVQFIDSDTYVCHHSLTAANLAYGSAIDSATAAVKGFVANAFAIVRPPGHHATDKQAMGFCLFDNVAGAAEHALRNLGLSRVLVVDWDIHHGNGIQDIFESRKDVLYISLHRHPFYPGTGSHLNIGKGEGEGYSVNIPWPQSGFGDADYVMAFREIVLPIARQFDPQLVLVASGFDSASGDPLGASEVSPQCYHWMTTQLLQLKDDARTPVVVCLEGGYNLTSISVSAEAVISALLHLPDDRPLSTVLQKETPSVIDNVKAVQSTYWNCISVEEKEKDISDELAALQVSGGNSIVLDLSVENPDDDIGGFVDPKKDCPHAESLKSVTDVDLAKFFGMECKVCGDGKCGEVTENWLCLLCHEVHCGRYIAGHMKAHALEHSHKVTVSMRDLNIWCYECDTYIAPASLSPTRLALARAKASLSED